MSMHRQVAALPLQQGEDGNLRVMLITSRGTRRYVLPKGWPWPGHGDHEAAAREALEEAGIVGSACEKSIGTFTYCKTRRNSLLQVTVEVYLLNVEALLDSWPEQHERTRLWCTLPEAAALVREPELSELFCSLCS